MLSRHLAGLCSVKRWSSPAGRPSLPLHLTFWTNWWDAHLATTLASDPTSKVTWCTAACGGKTSSVRTGVKRRAAQFAQQFGRWGSINYTQMGQKWETLWARRFSHRSPLLLVMCNYRFYADPQPRAVFSRRPVLQISSFFVRNVKLSLYVTHRPVQSSLDLWLWQKKADTLRHVSHSASGVTFHIYFILAPHPCQSIPTKSQLII